MLPKASEPSPWSMVMAHWMAPGLDTQSGVIAWPMVIRMYPWCGARSALVTSRDDCANCKSDLPASQTGPLTPRDADFKVPPCSMLRKPDGCTIVGWYSCHGPVPRTIMPENNPSMRVRNPSAPCPSSADSGLICRFRDKNFHFCDIGGGWIATMTPVSIGKRLPRLFRGSCRARV